MQRQIAYSGGQLTAKRRFRIYALINRLFLHKIAYLLPKNTDFTSKKA